MDGHVALAGGRALQLEGEVDVWRWDHKAEVGVGVARL